VSLSVEDDTLNTPGGYVFHRVFWKRARSKTFASATSVGLTLSRTELVSTDARHLLLFYAFFSKG